MLENAGRPVGGWMSACGCLTALMSSFTSIAGRSSRFAGPVWRAGRCIWDGCVKRKVSCCLCSRRTWGRTWCCRFGNERPIGVLSFLPARMAAISSRRWTRCFVEQLGAGSEPPDPPLGTIPARLSSEFAIRTGKNRCCVFYEYLRSERELSLHTQQNYKRQLTTMAEQLVNLGVDNWQAVDAGWVRQLASKGMRGRPESQQSGDAPVGPAQLPGFSGRSG